MVGLGRETSFTSYGHSCWEVRTPGGKTILFDPWFTNPNSTKPPEAVDRCDLLLVSHGHGHFCLYDQDVLDVTVVGLGPQMTLIPSTDQL